MDGAAVRAANAGVLRMVIDLAGVDYAMSAGLGAFLSADRLLQVRGGSLVLCGPGRDVMRLLGCSDLDRLLTIEGTLGEAIARL